MIVKKPPKKSFEKSTAQQISDLVDYIKQPHKINPEEKIEYAGARNFFSDTHAGQKLEMVSSASISKHSKMPVAHWILSWREEEQPTHDQVEQCVDIFLEEMGLKNHQAIFGLHKDTKVYHLHIAVNRMNDETQKVVEVNKGFDKEAAHKALAKIEAIQGWKPTDNARYTLLENGEIVRARRPKKEYKPKAKAVDFEHARGEKSAQRIIHERAYDIISAAKTWDELHKNLEKVQLKLEKKGSGAIIWAGETPVKASSIDRKFSLGKLEKRLGNFQAGEYGEMPSKIIEPVSQVNLEEWRQYQQEQENNTGKIASKKDDYHERECREHPDERQPEQREYRERPDQGQQPEQRELPARGRRPPERREYRRRQPHFESPWPLSRQHMRQLSTCRMASNSTAQREDILLADARFSRRTPNALRWKIHNGKIKRKKLPRFVTWLKNMGKEKEADTWRHRSLFEVQKVEEILPIEDGYAGEENDNFEKYSTAVQADRFRVTCIKMLKNGEKKAFILGKNEGVKDGFLPEEILQKMAEIVRIQARDENIYFTPLSEKKHHILIDDMTEESLKKFWKDGYRPAIILRSSPNNFQCIITIKKLGTEFDRDVGNRLAELLNREYGDKKLSGCIHPHRAPGFENRKPKHQHEDGTYPKVKLLYAERQECSKTQELSKALNSEIALAVEEQKKRRNEEEKRRKIRVSPGSPIAAYHAHLANIRQHLVIDDHSRVDSMIALRMRATGHSQQEIEEAIRTCACEMRGTNERRDWNKYAERTAAYAFSVAADHSLDRHKNYIEHWKRIEGRDEREQRARYRQK